MKEMRDLIRFWEHHRDESFALATLVRAQGSSYRRPGARMLIRASGESAGSVSAGCIEDEVIVAAQEVLRAGNAKLLSFDTRRRFGCSGSIEIFVEPVADQLLLELRARFHARQSCQIATLFENSAVLGSRIADGFVEESAFVQTIEPRLRLVVIGDGPDATALRSQTMALGWEVIVVEAVSQFLESPDARTAVVVATHNFGRDCAALRFFLPLSLRYVGLIGPRRRRDEILIDVIDSGAELRSQLFAPAGLNLGGDSAEEIALSILAEIQAVFRGETPAHLRDRKSPIHRPVPIAWTGSAH